MKLKTITNNTTVKLDGIQIIIWKDVAAFLNSRKEKTCKNVMGHKCGVFFSIFVTSSNDKKGAFSIQSLHCDLCTQFECFFESLRSEESVSGGAT